MIIEILIPLFVSLFFLFVVIITPSLFTIYKVGFNNYFGNLRLLISFRKSELKKIYNSNCGFYTNTGYNYYIYVSKDDFFLVSHFFSSTILIESFSKNKEVIRHNYCLLTALLHDYIYVKIKNEDKTPFKVTDIDDDELISLVMNDEILYKRDNRLKELLDE